MKTQNHALILSMGRIAV
uniref:Uncharacterized protein n=1 Tax=Anguilla anguilla TaxID=7936 RepID=A0A0E9SP48_ANGAN